MNWILALVGAIAIYPGLLAALVVAWILTWVRAAARAALGSGQLQGPLAPVNELRAAFGRDTVAPLDVQSILLPLATVLAAAAPIVAVVLLPVPGNPLVASIGLKGDLMVETILLLGVPFMRLFVGWAIPSPFGRLAADRNARILAGAVVPLAFAVLALAQLIGTFEITAAGVPPQLVLQQMSAMTRLFVPYLPLLARLLAAAAVACCLPVLARSTALREGESELDAVAGELTELSGRDLAIFRVAEALQLVAVSAFFAAAFVLPLAAALPVGQRVLLWVAAPLLTAVGIGMWEGLRGARPATAEKPPLSWWFGVPVLLALFALVLAAWVSRVG